MSNPADPGETQLTSTQPAVEIVHAQYHLALHRASSTAGAERERALLETRRLVSLAVSFRTSTRAEPAPRGGSGVTGRRPRHANEQDSSFSAADERASD